MKIAQTKIANPVRIVLNTTNPSRHQWAKIVDTSTGKVLHTGQMKHIKYVAKKRYNMTLA
jgi:hypothetical protein